MMKSFPGNKLTVLCMLFVFLPACTNTIAVPLSKYDSVDSERVKYWHVRTVDGRSYSVKRFSIENSVFVILNTGIQSKPSNKNRSYTKISDSELPLKINLEQIDTLEYIEISQGKIIGLIAVAAFVGAGILYLMIPYD